MRRSSLLIVAIVGLILIATAWEISFKRRETAVRLEVNSLHLQIAKARQETTAKSEELANLQKMPLAVMRAPSKAPKSSVAIHRNSNPWTQSVTISNDPQLRAWFLKAFVDKQRLTYGKLWDKFALTPKQREQFELIERTSQEESMDLAAAAMAQGISPSDSSLGPLSLPIRQKVTSQLEDLFGGSYPDWVQAVKSQASQSLVNQITQENFQGSGAFTPSQADQLTQILARHTAADDGSAGHTGWDWDAVTSEAQTILSPQQLEGFNLGVTMYKARAQMSAMERE